jgi:putative PIN family toxin of toxin-antitoxin system
VYQVVLDTSVLVAALRSRNGGSWRLLQILGNGQWRPNLTVAILLEYEAVLKRHGAELGFSEGDIDFFLDAVCSQSGLHRQYFSLRPTLPDPNDDLILEAAVASASDFIVSFNRRDFAGVERFGIRCLTPGELLILLREQR